MPRNVPIQISVDSIIEAAREIPETKMSPQSRKALAWAVRRAAEWRGSLVGNPDPAPLAEFDAWIKRARVALRMIRK